MPGIPSKDASFVRETPRNYALTIKEDEAPIVELIFDKFVNGGMGYSTIAGYLNRQGIPKPPSRNSHGRKFVDWSVHHIKRMLDNPVYTGRIAFGRTKMERIDGTENEYRRVKSDDYILSDEVVHEPIISDELFEAARRKRQEATTTGNPKIGRGTKHLLSGILKCPMCGSSMYADIVKWTNKDGQVMRKIKYQCGHYAKSKFGQCQKNTIPAEWVEAEVIEYTKLLVRNKQFTEDIKNQIGHKTDVSEIDAELDNYHKLIKKLEKSKSNLEKDIDAIYDDDKHAERKRQDMNNRLNKIYEEIYNIEDMIIDCEKKKEAAKQDVLTKENVFKMLLVFDKIFDKMNDADKRKLLESMIAEVHLHPKDTWQEGKNPIKEIKYAFPVSQEVMEALRENVASVETVVLLSKGMVDNRKVKVDFSLEDMDLSEFKGKATYEQIKVYVLEQTGLKVSNLYISQIKKKCGLDVGENFNLPKSENAKQPKCTPEKEEAIMQALKHFGII